MATIEQLGQALKNADAAGDVAAARALAAEIQRMRGVALEQVTPQQASTQQERASPPTAGLITNSLVKGIAAIPDAILNTPNRLMNLGRAAYGTAATAMGRADLAPNVTDDPNYVSSALEKVGLIDKRLDPVTSGQKIADMALQGGVGALAGPATGMRQSITNFGLGAAGGAAGSAAQEMGANPLTSIAAGMTGGAAGGRAIASAQNRVAATALRRQQNQIRDQTIADARNAGYVLSPSETNPSMINNMLEGIAGKLSTRQLASQRNQEVTNQLGRQDLNVPENVPISPELLSQLRRQAYDTGYLPVTQSGPVRPGAAYRRDLDTIARRYTGAAASFPDAVADDVNRMVDALRVRQFDAGDAIQMTQILRDDASASFANGNRGMGSAQREAARAIEDQIERNLQGQGGNGANLLNGFRDARRQIARTHTIEDSLFEGTGNVQASRLGAALRRGAPLSGGTEIAARTAESFPKNMQSPEIMGAVPGISPLDVISGAGMGAMGAAATGNASGALLGALPAVRPIVRSALLSTPYQRMMGTPNYRNSSLTNFLAQGDVNNNQANAALIAALLSNQK